MEQTHMKSFGLRLVLARHVITQRASQYSGAFVHLRSGLIILEPFRVLDRQWEFGFPTVRVREV